MPTVSTDTDGVFGHQASQHFCGIVGAERADGDRGVFAPAATVTA
jgi:hypothetical protein